MMEVDRTASTEMPLDRTSCIVLCSTMNNNTVMSVSGSARTLFELQVQLGPREMFARLLKQQSCRNSGGESGDDDQPSADDQDGVCELPDHGFSKIISQNYGH